MKTKKTYLSPVIDYIILDNQISLILQSEPPAGPEELSQQNTDFFRNNPLSNQQYV